MVGEFWELEVADLTCVCVYDSSFGTSTTALGRNKLQRCVPVRAYTTVVVMSTRSYRRCD